MDVASAQQFSGAQLVGETPRAGLGVKTPQQQASHLKRS